ncbi:cupin-like domain-containing protein [Roseateles sp. DXS20W]|uniref:Cupin-like domain-containing protein n=1 Tax=Pelomonas lactea TaxID=3299030 RepID=A0ABW7GK88_9BURK
MSAHALGDVPADVLRSTQPVVLRGLVAHWPMVQAARRSDAEFCDYLRGFGAAKRLLVWRGSADIGGRFFYNDDLSGFNFERQRSTLEVVLGELLAGSPDALYVGSTEIDAAFPALRRHNDLPVLAGFDPIVSLWLGNRIRVAPHFDLPDNIACVVAGRRRFTLFPPEQVGNLYIGPLDLTPAGQPISLVDQAHPDLDRFPRYAEALRHAQVFELEPGDALFLPSQWWHGVESLDAVSGLVNFWWRQSPPYMDTPFNALMMALLTLRDLPPAQRDAWRALFDHYVFDANAETAAHIPPAARGLLNPISDHGARQVRALLLSRLNR